MKKNSNAGDLHPAESTSNHNNGKNSGQPNRQRSNTPPMPQQDSRSDQEQEGRQNPAGDTRDVSRQPVDNEANKN